MRLIFEKKHIIITHDLIDLIKHDNMIYWRR